MKRILVLLAVSFIGFGQINCANNSNQWAENAANRQSQSGKSSPNVSPATPVAASDLIEAYRRNESSAGKDYMSRLYVNLKGDNPIIEVHCTYNDAEKEAMSALKEGQQVTIQGVCEGRLSTWIVLKDSVIQ
jgi:hypothetical protein